MYPFSSIFVIIKYINRMQIIIFEQHHLYPLELAERDTFCQNKS
jgi:hypothetical protein